MYPIGATDVWIGNDYIDIVNGNQTVVISRSRLRIMAMCLMIKSNKKRTRCYNNIVRDDDDDENKCSKDEQATMLKYII